MHKRLRVVFFFASAILTDPRVGLALMVTWNMQAKRDAGAESTGKAASPHPDEPSR